MWHGPCKGEMALQVGWYIFQALGACQTPNLLNKKIRLCQGLHFQSKLEKVGPISSTNESMLLHGFQEENQPWLLI
jgi:hypothetical protein